MKGITKSLVLWLLPVLITPAAIAASNSRNTTAIDVSEFGLKYTLPFNSAKSVVGDVNNDGENELVIGYNTGERNSFITILKFTGGSFAQLATFTYTGYSVYPLVADIDSDGKNELIVSVNDSDYGGSVRIYEHGGGTAWSQVWTGGFDTVRRPESVSVGDADNDGKNELVIGVDWFGRVIAVYEHMGGNTYQQSWSTGGNDFRSTFIGDCDNDSLNEIIAGTGNWSWWDWRVYEYNDSTYQYQLAYDSDPYGHNAAIVGDPDNDGKNEVMVASARTDLGENNVRIYRWDGLTKTFVAAWAWNTGKAGNGLTIGNLFNNGRNQLIFADGFLNDSESRIHIFEHKDGQYMETWTSRQTFKSSECVHAEIGDVDNDGANELVFSNPHHCVCIYGLAAPRNEVSGMIAEEVWTKTNSPYCVVGSITVPFGYSLTIEPGVDVLFDADAQFLVEGKLNAVGTEADSIRFMKGVAAEWGGIRITGSDSSTIHYARIDGGRAEGAAPNDKGGGIYLSGSRARLGLSHSVISNCSANYGGGIAAENSARLTMTSCRIIGNTASTDGGGLRFYSSVTATLMNCIVSNNRAAGCNAGVDTDNSTVTLTNCTINNNTAEACSGGIGGGTCRLTLTNCTISRNIAERSINGGVGVGNGSVLTVTKCTISGNRAREHGGGVYVDNSTAILTNCTITRDTSSWYNSGGLYANRANVALLNTILWKNVPSEIVTDGGGAISASYSDIRSDTVWAGMGNINFDPLFVDPDRDDFRLRAISKCIDAGDPSSPLDPDGTVADMGAFPYFNLSIFDIVTSSVPRATERRPYQAAIVARDHDKTGPLRFELLPPYPAWLSISSTSDTTAVLHGTPAQRDTTPGTAISVKVVRNTVDSVRSRTFVLTVLDTNYALRFALPDTMLHGREGGLVSHTFTVIDPDGDSVTVVSLTPNKGSVSWVGKADTTITLRWTWVPDFYASGTHSIAFAIRDVPRGGYPASEARDTLHVTIENVNGPPVWAPRADTSTAEGVYLTFTVSATDPDGDTLTYSPSQSFDWTPPFDFVTPPAISRDTLVIFSVTDGQTTVYDTVRIRVNNVNQPPVWTATPDQQINEGKKLRFTVSATDSDGQTLSYRALTLPTGAAFDTSGHVFDWTPTYTQAGQLRRAVQRQRWPVHGLRHGADQGEQRESTAGVDCDAGPTDQRGREADVHRLRLGPRWGYAPLQRSDMSCWRDVRHHQPDLLLDTGL